MGDYTRLVILHQRDHDPGRKQAIGVHLASLAPYAATADGTAAALIAQHYQAESDRLAGITPAPPEPLPSADGGLAEVISGIETRALAEFDGTVDGQEAAAIHDPGDSGGSTGSDGEHPAISSTAGQPEGTSTQVTDSDPARSGHGGH